MVPRRRDPDGRPAARPRRAAANRFRSSRRAGGRRIPATTHRRAGCGPLVLVLALNPARAAFGGPARGPDPARGRSARRVGGAIGGARRLSRPRRSADPLLDALDVSEPSFRIAAGIVAGLAGDQRPVPATASAGARAARPARGARPRRDPAVARPALLVLAIGAGADRRRPRQRRRDGGGCRAAGRTRRQRAYGRAPTAASSCGRAGCWPRRLVAGGAILTVDGVLDV